MPLPVAPGSRKARPLRPGDTIGIIAPAGPIAPEQVAPALERLHAWGYRTRLSQHVTARSGYLAGTDAQRLDDFHAIWSDPEVAGVLCARGGYGTMRLLPHLDWELIRCQPKFFCGFSDITALHVAMEQEAGLVTFHGPMAMAFGQAEAYNAAGLRRAMTETAPLGAIPWPSALDAAAPAPETPVPTVIRPGVAVGRLMGGNLSLLAALMGTPWTPDFTGRIVCLEEIDEPPYRIDRMLVQLLLGGHLQRAAGIVFGWSPSCMQDAGGKSARILLEVLADLLGPLGIPVLYGLPCGHEAHRATLPFGVQARLDAAAGTLTLLEGALDT